MALGRGKSLGYDVNRMSFRFTMFDADQVIECTISSTALDDLAEKRGAQPSERESQFIRSREVIEHAASKVFDTHGKGKSRVSMVQLFAKHFKKL